MLGAVMVGRPGAAQDRLPASSPGPRPRRPGVPHGPGEGCRTSRTTGTPARERGAAPPRQPGTLRAGRPGLARRAGPAHTAQALDRSLPGDARDAPRLAPQAGREEV